MATARVEARSRHILLVEDNLADAASFIRWLPRPPNRVDHVMELDDACQRATELRYDVALLDLSLPDSRGLETVTRFRGRDQDTALVVATGVEDPKLGRRIIEAGAEEFVSKDSLDAVTLALVMNRAIERRRIATRMLEDGLELRVRLACLERALDTLPASTIVLDDEDRVLYASARAQVDLGCELGVAFPVGLPEGAAPGALGHGWTRLDEDLRICLVPWAGGADARALVIGRVPGPSSKRRPTTDALRWRVRKIIDDLRGTSDSEAPRSDAMSTALEVEALLDLLDAESGPH